MVLSPWQQSDIDYAVDLRDDEIESVGLSKELDGASTDMLAVFDTRADT